MRDPRELGLDMGPKRIGSGHGYITNGFGPRGAGLCPKLKTPSVGAVMPWVSGPD